MQMNKNDLWTLAAQVGKGDRQARDQMQQRLEPEMTRILRRVLRKTVSGSAQPATGLERRLLAAADRAGWDASNHASEDEDDLASGVCESLLDRLETGYGRGQRMLATVCG
jgi:hypothetical protein